MHTQYTFLMKKYTEQQLRDAAQASTSIKQMLRLLHLNPNKWTHYKLVKRDMTRLNIPYPTGKSFTVEQLKTAVAASYSIRQVLIKLGLKPVGRNYPSIKDSIAAYEIDTSHFKYVRFSDEEKCLSRWMTNL